MTNDAEAISPRTSGHAFIDTIKRYYQGCNTADEALMRATFTDDVVHYFVDHGAVTGADALAHYWARVQPVTQAHWQLDHALVDGDEAVIEWSMRWTPSQTGKAELLRGSEWYRFRGGLISEIRSYHANHYLSDPANRALHDFPYAARGYRVE